MSIFMSYLATIIVFFFIFNIFNLGLNIQFGYAGILNFTIITFMAIGAYFYAVFAMPPADRSNQIYYILGLGWPWPLAMVAGIAASAGFGYLVGLVALKRLRSDYLAIVTLAIGSMLFGLAGNQTHLFDGWSGLFNVTQPFESLAIRSPSEFSWIFVGFTGIVMAIVWFFANRLYRSPLGCVMRAVREDQEVVDGFGKSSFRIRMIAMVIGAVIVGIGGILEIQYIGALSPSGWTESETFVVWAALLIGGRANNLGSFVGSFLVAVVFNETTRFLPSISPSYAYLVPNLRNLIIGILVIAVLWLRPQGVVPERRRSYLEIPLKDYDADTDIAVLENNEAGQPEFEGR